MKTYITGKDAPLEDSIANMQTALSEHGFNIIVRQWGNPAPNVWWVHINDAECPACFTNGKGTSKKAALASALGEYIERLSCNYFFADYYWGEKLAHADFVHYPDEKWFAIGTGNLRDNCPAGLLNEYLARFYDPDGELALSQLVDINSGNVERGICAIPFVRQNDGKTIYFPVNIIGNLYVSNGMAAGNNPDEARTQALSEILERYVKHKIIAEAIALPLIPGQVLARHPQTLAAITALQNEGYLLHCFDASLGGRFPVICVALLNRDNGGCFASFGAHPSFAVALERAVTELLQGRQLKEMRNFSPPSFADELVADTHNLETHFIDSSGLVSWDLYRRQKDYEFIDWDFSDSSDNELAFLGQLMTGLGADIYIADYKALGIYACRVMVPGLSEIYPLDELTQYNNNIAVVMRATIQTLPAVALSNSDTFMRVLAWLDDSGLDDNELVCQVFGFAAADDNDWASLRLGELRCLLLLALQMFDEALDMAEWVITFGISTLSDKRRRFYQCLIEQLQLALDDERSPDDYVWIRRTLYGESIYQAVCEHVSGQAAFYHLTVIDKNVQVFSAHRQLLDAYQKWQAVKAESYCKGLTT